MSKITAPNNTVLYQYDSLPRFQRIVAEWLPERFTEAEEVIA